MTDPHQTRRHGDLMHRFAMWMHREPLSAIAAVVVCGHVAVVAMYLTGAAFSSVPFSDDRAQTIANSPIVWISHLLAALAVASAINHSRWRGIAAGASTFVWFAFAAAVLLGTQYRIPPLSPIAAFLAGILGGGVALVLQLEWRGSDEGQ